jgi:anti-sigma regulatory factor (Ser/Thr protein kinase)
MHPSDAPLNTTFEVILRGDMEAGGVARRAIATHDPGLPQPVMEDVSLLVTELVTNAVRYADGVSSHPVRFGFQRRDGTIRVEVIDVGTGFQAPSPPTNGDATGGWGLFLVDRIAARWGVSPARAGTCVWFELPATAPP